MPKHSGSQLVLHGVQVIREAMSRHKDYKVPGATRDTFGRPRKELESKVSIIVHVTMTTAAVIPPIAHKCCAHPWPTRIVLYSLSPLLARDGPRL